MTDRVECHYQGHDFTAGEMALLRALIAGPPLLSRHALSRGVLPAHRLVQARRRPQGHDGPGGHAGHAQRRPHHPATPEVEEGPAPPRPIIFGQDTEVPLLPAPTTLDEVRPLELRTVVGATREGRLWNEFVARYHYLGYKPLVGAQMRYAVHEGYPPGVSLHQICPGERVLPYAWAQYHPIEAKPVNWRRLHAAEVQHFRDAARRIGTIAVSARLGYPARVAYAVTPTLPNAGTAELSSSQREKTWTPGASTTRRRLQDLGHRLPLLRRSWSGWDQTKPWRTSDDSGN